MNRLLDLARSQSLCYLSPDATAFEASQEMSQKHVGAVLVGSDANLLGLFSERDLMNRVVSKGLDYYQVKVADVMTRSVTTIGPDETIEHCHDKMIKLKCRHLPIKENGKIIGMVSIRDVMEWMVEDKDAENKVLKQYIQT